jgi:RHS repeat-associated protein
VTDVKVKNSSGTVVQEDQFTYDVNNLRIGKSLDPDGSGPQPAVQTWTVYDGAVAYADFNGSGSLTARYLAVLASGLILARLDATGNTLWHLTDLLGSVRQFVDASGNVQDQVAYASYGKVLSETSSSGGDRFKFTGRDYDAELSTYYFRQRYYDPACGRFMSNDPIQFHGGDGNLYRYVGNSPVIYVDPTGLWSTSGAFGGAITGAGLGAGIGCIGGPLGAIIGGGIGFVGGLLGGGFGAEPLIGQGAPGPGNRPTEGELFAAGLIIGTPIGIVAGLIGLGAGLIFGGGGGVGGAGGGHNLPPLNLDPFNPGWTVQIRPMPGGYVRIIGPPPPP